MDEDSRSKELSEFEDFRNKNKEHTYLVYYMRKLLGDCVISKNGIIEPIDWSDTLLEESFNIMSEVEYALGMMEYLERLLKREGLDTSELENIDITKGYDIINDDVYVELYSKIPEPDDNIAFIDNGDEGLTD
ncbi:MAG: hypothetical protein P8Q32_01435 [Candidatus Thalassarchaeaceae archaeon]|nr:hypothetical protein [Candidatus Thalassarchaeaceae archaeon]